MILSLITLCRARGHYIYTPALAACLTMIIIDHSHWLYQQGEDELEILFLAKSQLRERKLHHTCCADVRLFLPPAAASSSTERD